MFTVIIASIQQHLHKDGIIISGRNQSATAGIKAAAIQYGVIAVKSSVNGDHFSRIHHMLCFIIRMQHGQTVLFFLGDIKIGILHAQRLKNIFAEEPVQAHSAHYFYQITKDIRVQPIRKFFTGLMYQRQCPQFFNIICKQSALQPNTTHYTCFEIDRIHGFTAYLRITYAGTMC